MLNLAREGLRTLVIAHKKLARHEYEQWLEQYEAARCSITDRSRAIDEAMERLESDMTLLGITGVEDALQDQVSLVLE